MTETNTLRLGSHHFLSSHSFLPLTPPPPTSSLHPEHSNPSTGPPRRGSLPSPSKASLGLSKLLTPISVSLSIDNPVIFLHPPQLPPDLAQSLAPNPSTSLSHPTNHSQALRDSHPPLTSSSSSTSSTSPPPPSPPLPPSSFNPIHFVQSNPSPLDHPSSLSFSNPNQTIDNNNTVLSGTLVLKLLRPKELKKITISLWGQSYIGFNDRPYEHQTVLSNRLEIDLATQLHLPNQHANPGKVYYNARHKTYVLDRGDYRFCWSFMLPCDLPPYERGQFGRTLYKVIGKVKFSSSVGFGTIGKNLSSLLVGVGGGGHEVETESYFVAVCNPTGNDGEANGELSLNLNVTDVSDHLGPYTLAASSAYFTVAGLVHFKLRLNNIPMSKKIIKIYKITSLIKQQYKLISMRDIDPKTGSRAESWPACQRRRIFVLDHSNVGEVNQDWHPSWSDDESHERTEDTVAGPLTTTSAVTATLDVPISASSSETVPQSTLSGEIESPEPSGTTSSNSTPTRHASRSTSRSRSRIRDLIMTRSVPRDTSSRDRDESTHHGWATSLGQLMVSRRQDPSLSQSSQPQGSRSRSRSRRRSKSVSHEPLPSSSDPRNPQHTAPPLPSGSALNGYTLESHLHSLTRANSPPARSPARPSELQTRHSDFSPTSRLHSASSPPTSPGLGQDLSKQRGRSAQIRSPEHQRLITPQSKSRQRSRFDQLGGGSGGPHVHDRPRNQPLVTLTDDHSAWEIQHIGRLPNDDSIRPSTYPGTQTNIRIFHTLLFEISYTVEDEDKRSSGEPNNVIRRVLSIGKPVQIVSCCCMLESMILPPYSKSDPNAEVVQHPTPQHAARMFKCVCGISTETLLKTQHPNHPEPRALNYPSEANPTDGSLNPTPASTTHAPTYTSQSSKDSLNCLRRTTHSTVEFRTLPYSSSATTSSVPASSNVS